MDRPRVSVASLGGTITMTSAARGGPVEPRLSADELLEAVPGLVDVAEVAASTLAAVPSASLGFSDALAALEWAEHAVRGGARGAVLVQGTDTLEEMAYLLDLYWDRPEPLVLTGAMRTPQQEGAEGPANLLAAVRVAASAAARGHGVTVVMNDEIHAARWVGKSHATNVAAFTSPGWGPLGHVVEQQVIAAPAASRWPPLPRPAVPGDRLRQHGRPRVALLELALGEGPEMLLSAVHAGYDGVVLAGFGAGHVSAAVSEAVSDVASRMPVVVASRTGAGSTLRHTYGYPGSECDLVDRGALMAGWLAPRKARLLLWALLAAEASADRLGAELTRRGSTPVPQAKA
ncbi:asparaginase [Ornithinicoccus halotolerans]|uniref:asparaginase n=1 Tax=Ornithinicoccus halotolerans TaxID=1748220 RepID=UPI0012963D50|nr:asparaginase [Ornithinicoccus halotolerans]